MSYDGTLTFATTLDASGFEAGVARLGGIMEGLALPVDRQAQWGVEAGTAFTGGFAQVAAALPGVAAGILGQAAASAGAFGASAFREVGLMLANGLAAGVSAGQSTIVQAVAGSVNAAIAAAKSRLGIASPSRLFRDEVGRMMMAGWAGGIADGTRETIAATQSAAQAVQTAAQRTPMAAALPGAASLGLAQLPSAVGGATGEGGAAAPATHVTNLTQHIHSPVALSPAEMTREAESFLRRTSWQLN